MKKTKAEIREKKNKLKITASGKSVFVLKEILKKPPQKKKRAIASQFQDLRV